MRSRLAARSCGFCGAGLHRHVGGRGHFGLPPFTLFGFCSTRRTFLPPTERSDRGNTSVGHRTRVLQPLLPCSKERRRPEAHSGSAASEFFPLQRVIQDADDETIMSQIQGGDWFVTIDLKDALFLHPGDFYNGGAPLFSRAG